MYNGKKIIVLSGKIGSGKSYLLNILKKNTKTLCIDCDKEVKELIPKAERERILNLKGLKYLENLIYPHLKAYLLNKIMLSDFNVVAIEGIKAKKLFKDIMDVEIEFDVSEKIRRERVLKRGDSLEKFNYFNKLQKNL